MTAATKRRLAELESRRPHRIALGPPTYITIREGEPRPDVVGPVYVLVKP